MLMKNPGLDFFSRSETIWFQAVIPQVTETASQDLIHLVIYIISTLTNHVMIINWVYLNLS